MRRLERLHAITHHLRARAPRVVSVTAMAERFEVSTRTIERDLRSLHNAGIPLYAVDGRAGGYSILPDFTMQPVRLTAQEATVCLAALSMMRDSPYRRSATTASDKIAASLPAAVSDAINPHEIASIRDARATSSIEWADARDDRRLVEIVYGDDPTARMVEPYTALRAGQHWYLVGWCRNRQAVRGFRVDRVVSIVVSDDHFEPVHAAEVAADLSRWDT